RDVVPGAVGEIDDRLAAVVDRHHAADLALEPRVLREPRLHPDELVGPGAFELLGGLERGESHETNTYVSLRRWVRRVRCCPADASWRRDGARRTRPRSVARRVPTRGQHRARTPRQQLRCPRSPAATSGTCRRKRAKPRTPTREGR